MISRAIVKAWLLNVTVVVTVLCSSCTTLENEKKIGTVNQQLFVQLDIETGKINGVTQDREFKSAEFGDGVKGVVNMTPQAITVIDGVTAEGLSFRCCPFGWWWNCFNISELIGAYSFNPALNSYELDFLGTPDGNGGVRKLERVDFDPTATIKEINVFNHNIGTVGLDAGTGPIVIDDDGTNWY